ncbi:Ubiquitin carboxyl-terminal hydrolase 21 [Nibea albiflora]|uniref:Ubiquitin carboxyl-terminal hydrolase 21 n=1 Tax=Nibea albiflora TaxID=240163 RepID=A0ACB7EZ94_NIBAL|nr:Ubiquitin carboxyl-terminal hydrolase 21 [Nibea albiflora]
MSSWGNTFNPVKYHGLINQGATCYLNSVLQVLFMTEDFREAVERDTFENPDHDCIDRHLSSLFADLKEREAYTFKITRKLGITRVYEQQDAAEYYEKILRLIRSGASQVHGIADYFRSSEFSGDNQMYCEQCDAKSDATIKCVIKHHPDVLMLLLKRFEFNYSYMTYVKINRTVVVPFTLQIPENQTYELYAVVDHFGDLRSGHYTATIKDDERWYTFDDSRVTLSDYQPFQEDNFEKSCSAYLLFYRKISVSAADTQNNMEVSTPEVILPAPTPVYDQYQYGKMRKREEAEEEGNATVAIDINEETGIKDSAGSTEVGLPPDLCNTLKNQDTKSYNDHESNEETNNYQDVNAKKQRDEEDVGGSAQAGGKTEDDEQPERKGESYPDRAVGYQDNAREGLRGTQEAGQDDDVKPVSVQMEGNTGEGERSSEGEKLFELQDNRREGDSEESMPGDDQTRKQDNSRMSNIPEQQRQDKIYVKEHKDGDDKHVEDQNNEGNIRQNQPEQKISVVSVKRQTEEQVNTREERIRDKADSSLRRAGSAGSRLTENQQVGDDEKTRQHAPPQVRPADKRHGSKKSKVHVKIIEEEIRKNRSGTVTDHIQIETVEEFSQQGTLSMEFDNLLLEKPEPKNRGIKIPSGNHSNSRKQSRLQLWWAQRKRKMQMRGKKRKHRKGKKKKSPGCLSMFQSSQKKKDETSESD